MQATQSHTETNGTSWFGTSVFITPNELKAIAAKLNANVVDQNYTDEKVKMMVDFKTTKDEYPFTVYDIYTSSPLVYDKEYEFHIGGYSLYQTEEAKKEFLEELKKIRQ